MRCPCRISETFGKSCFGRIFPVIAFTAVIIIMGCGSGDDSNEDSSITITNSSTGSVTIYYAWENDDCEVDQQTEIIAAGATHTIRMQTSLFGDGIFTAKNASNAFHTYEVQFNDSGALPVTISNGDF